MRGRRAAGRGPPPAARRPQHKRPAINQRVTIVEFTLERAEVKPMGAGALLIELTSAGGARAPLDKRRLVQTPDGQDSGRTHFSGRPHWPS